MTDFWDTASKLGTDLTDIEDNDDEDEVSSEEEDVHSSRGIPSHSYRSDLSGSESSMRLNRASSGESIYERRRQSEDSDSNRVPDFVELNRSRLKNPGSISMFGVDTERSIKVAEEDAQSNAEKARKMFDLPATEKIISSTTVQYIPNTRISRLVDEERYDTRIYGSNPEPYLFLCPTSQDRCTSLRVQL